MMLRTIRPFQPDTGWFPIHNYTFDVCMPNLSNAGWRVLCVAIRKTLGWMAENAQSTTERKEWDQISYSQFMEASGLRSPSSITKGIQENLDAGYLIRRRIGYYQGTGAPIFAYALNQEFEAQVLDRATTESVVEDAEHKISTTKSVVAATTKNEVAATTESVETKQRKKTNKHDDGDDPIILQKLTAFGVEPGMAQQLLPRVRAEDLEGWLAYLDSPKASKITAPPAFLVSRLLAGVAPPPAGQADERQNRYLRGEYAQYIQT